MSTIKTATLKSIELSEELDNASLQAITGGVLFLGSAALLVAPLAALGYIGLVTPPIAATNS